MNLNRRQFSAALAGSLALAGCASTPAAPAAGAPKLYYLGQAKVFAMDAETGAVTTLVDHMPADGSRPTGVNDGIAVLAATGQIFWTNMGKAAERDGYIMRCERDGSGVMTIVPPGGTFTPKQLKIDEQNGKLYWSDREGMAVMRCNLDGSLIETIVAAGSPVTDKGDQSRWCVGMAVDAGRGHVYWTQKGGDNAGQGVIRRIDMQAPRGSTPTNRRDMITLFSRLPEPIDLDLDLKSRTLYWTDRGDNTVSRAPLDPPAGFDPARRLDRQVLVRGLKEAIGVGLDLPRGQMAYTSLGGEVGVSNTDGTGARMLATGGGMLTGICWA
jgi:sugar lactone lactonase YvrE